MHPETAGTWVCALVAVIVYVNTLPANFAFDDSFAVVHNADVISDTTPLRALLIHDFWGQLISSPQSHKSWRPLTVLCFRLLRRTWGALPEAWRRPIMARRALRRLPYEDDEAGRRGLDPLPFHIANVLLHCLTSAVVCRLSYFLLRRRWQPRSLLIVRVPHEGELGRPHHQLKQRQWLWQPRRKNANPEETHGSQRLVSHSPPGVQPGRWKTAACDSGLDVPTESLPLHPQLRRRHKPPPAAAVAAAAAVSQPSGAAGHLGRRQGIDIDVTYTLEVAEVDRRRLQLHIPAWFSGLAFAVHPVHTEAVAGVVGFAELLCAVLSVPAAMLYVAAAEDAASRRAAGRWTRGSVALHWVSVATAASLAVAAALAKEIGITVLGFMVVADILIIPLVVVQPKNPYTRRTMMSRESSGGGGCCAEGDQGSRTNSSGGAGVSGSRSSFIVSSSSPPASRGAPCLHRVLRLVLWAVVEEPKWGRMALVAAIGVVYVRLRSWVAVDPLVRIYRQVENPIAFSHNPLERVLSTAYLHARYAALLLWPNPLSADWSFDCVPLVHRPADPRNLLAVALYGYLAATVLAARPWGVLAEWWRAAAASVMAQEEVTNPSAAPGSTTKGGCGPEDAEAEAAEVVEARLRLWGARWRLCVLAGLTVGPFLPAANVFFYVGTFIGERLLYLPSVGFCLLLAEGISRVVQWLEVVQRSGKESVPGEQQRLHHYPQRQQQQHEDEEHQHGPDHHQHQQGEQQQGHRNHALKGHKMVQQQQQQQQRIESEGVAGPADSGSVPGDLMNSMEGSGKRSGGEGPAFAPCSSSDDGSGGDAGGAGGGLASASAAVAVDVAEGHRRRGGGGGRREWQTWRTAAAAASRRVVAGLPYVFMVLVLVSYSIRTWIRNWDWQTEETLFNAAAQVCPRSAKVQLNLGILQRRRGHQQAALSNFIAAREIAPGYCEPGYWVGVALINLGDAQSGLRELESSLSCPYVAAEALKALNSVFIALHSANPGDPQPVVWWGRVLLRPDVGQLGPGCDLVEWGALIAVQRGATREVDIAVGLCEQALTWSQQRQQQQQQREAVGVEALWGDTDSHKISLDRIGRCLEARQPVYRAIAIDAATAGPKKRRTPSRWVLAAVYNYIRQLDAMPYCRLPAAVELAASGHGHGSGDLAMEATSAHMHLIHSVQSTDPRDPWLQAEWGRTLAKVGRTQEAVLHLSAAAALLHQQLESMRSGGNQGGARDGDPRAARVRSLAASGTVTIDTEEALRGMVATLEDAAKLQSGIKAYELWGQAAAARRMLAMLVATEGGVMDA